MTPLDYIRDVIIKTTRLVTLPEVYFLVRDTLEDPTATHDDLAAVVGRDPSLAARLLKIANSAWFGYAGRIDTLQRAVMLIGTQRLQDMVLASSVAAAFSGVSPHRLDVRAFWVNSAFSAAAGRLLGWECNVLNAERIFVAGLLRDIGHLLLYQAAPEPTLAAREEAAALEEPLDAVQRRLLGCDFAQVGGDLLQHWQVPAALHQAVRWQLDPAAGGEARFDAALLNLVGVMTEAFARRGEPDVAFTGVADDAWDIADLTPARAAGVYHQARGETEIVTELLFSPLLMG